MSYKQNTLKLIVAFIISYMPFTYAMERESIEEKSAPSKRMRLDHDKKSEDQKEGTIERQIPSLKKLCTKQVFDTLFSAFIPFNNAYYADLKKLLKDQHKEPDNVSFYPACFTVMLSCASTYKEAMPREKTIKKLSITLKKNRALKENLQNTFNECLHEFIARIFNLIQQSNLPSDIIESLLEMHFSQDYCDNTFIHLINTYGSIEQIKYLVEKELLTPTSFRKINRRNQTVLMAAAKNEDPKVIEELINKLELTEKDPKSYPLNWEQILLQADRNSNCLIAHLLKNKNISCAFINRLLAKIGPSDERIITTILAKGMFARLLYLSLDKPEIFSLLLQCPAERLLEGASLIQNSNKKTIVHKAAKTGNSFALNALLKHIAATYNTELDASQSSDLVAYLNKRIGRKSKTLVHYALESNDVETCKLLFEHFDNIKLRRYTATGNNYLHYLAKNVTNEDLLDYLLPYFSDKFDFEELNTKQQMPLHKASKHSSSPQIFEFLLDARNSKNGFPTDNKKDSKGDTALHYAARYGNQIAIDALCNNFEFNFHNFDITKQINDEGKTPFDVALQTNQKLEVLLALTPQD